MIPIRVAVEGFMSYRDRATLDFEGAPLWMLSGPNGAGKSSIFDAITFALFGLHRGGKQSADELINQASEGLAVEFDFAIGEDVYRVKRTLPRKGRASVQGFHLRGPNPPSKRPSPQAVPETDQKSGFESWVENLVGLDDETFTASVLLQQGKSDVLLEANPARRHQMLAQIVDLSAYQNLHAKADTRRRDLEATTKTLNTQLAGIEPVDEATIIQLDQESKAAAVRADQLRDERLKIARWQAEAKQWETLAGERGELQAALDAAQVLFADAHAIERDAARFAELKDVLLRLSGLLAERIELRDCIHLIAGREAEAARWSHQVESAAAALEAATLERAAREKAEAAARERRDHAGETRLALAAAVQELNELERVREAVASLDEQLQDCTTDLDERRHALEDEDATLRELDTAIPWLEEWISARTEWAEARAKATTSEAESKRLAADLSTLAAEIEATTQQRAAAVKSLEARQNEVTQARTLLEQVKKQLGRFEQVDKQPACSYCGQPLTPDHLEQERARLEKERDGYLRDLQAISDRLDEAHAKQQHFEQAAYQLEQKRRALEQQKYKADCQFGDARDTAREIAPRAEKVLAQLPEEWVHLIRPEAGMKLARCFAEAFPGEDDIAEAREQVAARGPLQEQLKTCREEIARRDTLRARREPAVARLSTLQEKYPPAAAAALHEKYSEAQRAGQEADEQLKALHEPLRVARDNEAAAATALREAREKGAAAFSDARAETVRRDQIERGLEKRRAELPQSWREIVASLDEAQLQARLDEWRHEAGALDGAQHRLEALSQARLHHDARQARLHTVEAALEAIAPEARRPAAELAEEEAQAGSRAAAAAREAEVLRSEKQSLEETRMRRADLQNDFDRAAHGAQLHKILADLLGRDKLQRFLLQQAEAGIVENANSVLDRISGGTLRLELRRVEEEDDESRRARSNTQKALDLVAYNTESGGRPMPVFLLSGSQRFRVAVSLALGIGQFASQSAHRIESVIIDEGFGSLDQEGRRAIIDELHNLKSVLKRIVVVSHQEEFADSFPNRYAIELKDGTSTASLIGAE